MGGAAADSPVVTADGVTVRKRLNQDHPEHLAVLFEIRSERSDAVRLRIRDSIPSTYRIGFHPDFGGQHWSTTEDGVEFDRTINPDETYDTAYAVGDATPEKVNSLAVEPVVEVSSLDEGTDSPEPSSDVESGPESGLLESEEFDISLDAGSVAEGSGSGISDLGLGSSEAPDQTPGGAPDLDAADIDDPATDQELEAGPIDSEDESVRVAEPGVVVEKRLDQEKFTFPAVVFEITSTADSSMPIRIEDRVPEAVDPDDIAFHHRYGDDHWQQTGQQVVFEREVDAGEEFTTLYAVRGLPPDSEGSFLEVPMVTFGDGPQTAPGGSAKTADATDSLGTSAESSDGSGATPPAGPSEDPAASQPSVDSGERERTAGGSTDGTGSSDRTDEPADDDGGSLADLLTTESSPPDPGSETDAGAHNAGPDSGTSEGGSAAEEHGLAGAPEPTDDGAAGNEVEPTAGGKAGRAATDQSGWVSARFMERTAALESTVASLAESMETHQIAIADLQEDVGAFRADLNAARETLERIESQVTDIASAVEHFETPAATDTPPEAAEEDGEDTAVAQLQETVSDLAEEVSLLKQSLASELETSHQLRTDLDAVGSEVGDVSDAARAAADRTVSIDESLDRQQSLLETTVQSLDALDSQQAELRETTEALTQRLDELADRIDGIDESIED